MIYAGTIKTRDGKPIAGAALQFVNSSGTLLHSIPVTTGGVWQLDSETDGGLLDPGISAVFTAPGYYSYTVSASLMPVDFYVTLTKKVAPEILLAAGAGVALLVASSPGRKMMGAVETESKRQGLPPWAIPVGLLGLGAIALVAFLNKPDPKGKDAAQLPADAQKQVDDLGTLGITPVLSQAALESMASRIVEATDDCGTDEQALFDVFAQLVSEADLWNLIKVFGVRQIKSCFGGNWFGDTPYNLPQIIQAELSTDDIETINNIFRSKGFIYKF